MAKRPLTDYYELVARAVSGGNDDQSRQSTYDRVRRLQLEQLRKVEPPLNGFEINRERQALEQAIRIVERDVRRAANCVSDQPPFTKSLVNSNVRRYMPALILGLIVIQTLLLAWLLLVPIPTTSDLDADLNQVREEIKQASDDSNTFGPGLLKSLIEIRRQALQNTEAMLSQKKLSILRRINLDFEIDGSQLRPASDDALNDIKEKITQAEQKLTDSEKNASQYTGGLVQSMALMTVETDQLALSQLRLKYYSAKYGLPVFFPQGDTATKQQQPAAGKVVQDRDAL